jgi:hypothetical protein
MAITSYSTLQTAVQTWAHRGDLTAAQIQEFIALAESDLQVRAKLTQWEQTGTVTITDGSGPLPSDFASMKSVEFGSSSTTLSQVSPQKYQYLESATEAGIPINYAIIGDELKLVPIATGTASILYTARFTPLSDSATTNSLLELFPDVYLQGALAQFAIWSKDDVAMQRHGMLFDAGLSRVRKYTAERRYGDAPLAMRLG